MNKTIIIIGFLALLLLSGCTELSEAKEHKPLTDDVLSYNSFDVLDCPEGYNETQDLKGMMEEEWEPKE